MPAIVPGGGRSVTSRSPFQVDPYKTAVHWVTFSQAVAADTANKELIWVGHGSHEAAGNCSVGPIG
jgi:hypothetical protein